MKSRPRRFALFLVAIVAGSAPGAAFADEGGVSFWLPGTYGSLAAQPATPGWTLNTTGYATFVTAGGSVARARAFTFGDLSLQSSLDARLKSNAESISLNPTYAFADPVLGGQLSLGVSELVGRNFTAEAGTLTVSGENATATRSGSVSGALLGYGDLAPQAFLQWNQGFNNFMIYTTANIPTGTYSPSSVANLGIGHAAVDGGAGYTYYYDKTGHEFSTVVGMTYNFFNPLTRYQSGADFHLDWGASQYLSKQVFVGAVGYFYDESGCDGGAGDKVGCFQSRAVGAGPQVGYNFPVGGLQGSLTLKGYGEFLARDRPSGANVWLIFTVSPAAPASTMPIQVKTMRLD